MVYNDGISNIDKHRVTRTLNCKHSESSTFYIFSFGTLQLLILRMYYQKPNTQEVYITKEEIPLITSRIPQKRIISKLFVTLKILQNSHLTTVLSICIQNIEKSICFDYHSQLVYVNLTDDVLKMSRALLEQR